MEKREREKNDFIKDNENFLTERESIRGLKLTLKSECDGLHLQLHHGGD
jgi:hypothetical protein